MTSDSASSDVGAGDSQILQQVEREMRQPRGSNTPFVALGAVLAASLYIGVLALAQARRVEVAHFEVAHLEVAHLEVAHLEVAHLEVAHLEVAHLEVAHLEVAPPTPRWVNWTYSLEEAQTRAATNHQKIFIDFYTDWCPACKEMDSLVYTRQEVLAQSQNAVMVKINAEGREDLAKRYNIRVLPTFVWTDANGAEVARHDGSAGAPTLAGLMAQNR